jgi:glucokinase
VFSAASVSDARATAIVDKAVDAAAQAAWTFCHTFLPQRIILGGGMMDDQFETFATAMRQRLSKATQFSHAEVSVVRATLGNDAGVVGAASVAWCRGRIRKSAESARASGE